MTTLDLTTLAPTDISNLQLDHLDLTNIPGVPSENILTPSRGYKPFRYEWAYQVFLVQNQVHWLPDEVPLADDVKDWNTKLTPQEHHLVRQTFRLFTQCYSDDTEILTPLGWKLLSELTDSDKVAQVDDSGKMTFVIPTNRQKYKYCGPMYHFKDGRQRTDILVTPNHKMVYEKNGVYTMSRADELHLMQGVHFKRTVTKDHAGRLSPYERLCIMFQADGKKYRTNGEKNGKITHHFSFKKQRKITRFVQLCEFADVDYKVTQGTNGYTYCNMYLDDRLPDDFSWVDLEAIGTSWSQDFLDELFRWDGSVTDFNGTANDLRYSYTSTNHSCIEVVSQLLAISGYDHAVSGDHSVKNKELHNPVRVATWSHKSADVDGQALRRSSRVIDYDGLVYCVTVPSGVVLVRRNRCVLVCGNSDTDLNESYGYNYLKRFVASELLSANSAIGNIESIHRAAYSHLLDTLGLPEEEYVKFYDFPEMLAKHNYMTSFRMDTIHNTAVTLAGLGAFTEGVQLYASFAILLNFTRHNKLKGMGQVVAWSQRDESLHADYNVLLFKTLTTEFATVLDADKLREDILTVCHQVIANEDRYIDLVFELGPVEGMTADSLKEYIRNIMDERMSQLGYEKPFGCANPFPWITDLLSGVEHTNFFENRSTGYSKAASKGTWDEVFGELIK